MRTAFLLLVPIALASCAAAPQPAADAPSQPAPPSDALTDGIVRAAMGERVYVDGPYVTPLEVMEDSRCPINARCVWAGRVRVSVKIELGSGSEIRLIGNDQPIKVADGQLSLAEVLPQRKIGEAVEPTGYRFGFRFAGGL